MFLKTLRDLVIPPWVKLVFHLAPYLVIVGLLSGLLLTRSTLQHEKDSHKLQVAQAALAVANVEMTWGKRIIAAQTGYSKSLSALQKVKDTSYADTAAYAKTPAGSHECLTADRMSGIAAYARSAEAAIASSGSAGQVSGDGDSTQGP